MPLECSETGCDCNLKTSYLYNGRVVDNSRLEAEIDQRTVDLRIRLENIGTQPFYPVLSEREKRIDQVGHMTIDSEVVLDPDRNCRNESEVIDLNAIFYCLKDFKNILYRYLLCLTLSRNEIHFTYYLGI